MEKTYKDKVAVIIPLYNSEKYMGKTINSVFEQTYKNYEIILVDDCSTDGTSVIANMLCSQNEKVRYIRLDKNSGAAVARNIGMESTDARYIAFLDSDDFWDYQKLEKQVYFMKENDYEFTFSAYDMVDEDGKKLKEKIYIDSVVAYKDLLTKTMISTPTVMFDRCKVGNVSMPLRRTGQDYAFWLLLLRETNAHGIDEALVHICRRKNSLSKNKFQNIRDIWEIQTKNEKIHFIKVIANVFKYCIYTVSKRYL